MPNKLDKPLSSLDGSQTLQGAYNDTDATYSVSGFATSKVGNKILRTEDTDTQDTFRFMSVFATYTGDIADTSDVISGMSSTVGLVVGMLVNHGNFPPGTVILSIDSPSQVTVSEVAIGSESDADIQFATPLYTLIITYDDASHSNVNSVERTE